MKKILIALLSLLALIIIVIVGLVVGVEGTTYDLYKEQEHAQYDEVFNSDTPTIYYYYQDTCGYCNSIKDQITDIALILNERDDIDFKLIDLKDSKNQNAWYDWSAHNAKYGEGTDPRNNPDFIYEPEKMKTPEDIKITGTPGMIYVEDNKVVDYEIGVSIFDTLEDVKQKYNIDYTFDRSKYGE